MIPADFYPTDSTVVLSGSNTIELTDNVVSTQNGKLTPYWVGYVEYNKIPDFFIPRILEYVSGETSYVKIKKVSIDNSDLAYVQKNGNSSSNNALNYNYDNNTTPAGNSNIYYKAFNAMSPLNFPVISLSSGYRIRLYLYFCYCFDGDRYKISSANISFETIKDFLDYMHGDIAKTVTFSNLSDTSGETPVTGLSHTISDLSINDISGRFYGDLATIGTNSCQFYISIVGFRYNRSNGWRKNNGYSVSGSNCYAIPAIKLSCDTNILYFNNTTGDRDCYATNVSYVNSGSTQYISGISPVNAGGSNAYLNGEYMLCTPVDDDGKTIDFIDYKDNPDTITFLKNGAIVYDSPSPTGNFKIVPCLKASDILMYFAMFPSLAGGSADDVYLPLFDGNILTGDFFPLSELNEKGTPWQKQDDISKNEYKESDKPHHVSGNISDDPNKITGDSYPTQRTLGLNIGNAMCTMYDMSGGNVTNLISHLSNSSSGFWESIGTATDYKESNILDYIVSLRFYPFQIYNELDVLTNSIKFGFNSGSVINIENSTTHVLHRTTVHHSHGSIYTSPKNGEEKTFLDFEPYTTCKIFLPYLGLVQLPSIDVIDCTLVLDSFTDLVTGMCTYYIDSTRDNITKNIYVGSCKIGCDISVSGNNVITQSERTASAYVNLINDVLVGAGNFPKNIVEGRKWGVAYGLDDEGNIAGVGGAIVDLAKNVVSDAISLASSRRAVPEKVSSGSESGNLAYNNIARLIIERPAIRIPATYGHEFGYPYNQSENLSSYSGSGLVVCSNPDINNISCTEREREMIYSHLVNGVIL